MIVRELVTTLGFKIDDRNLKRFEQAIHEFKNRAQELNTALSVAKKGVIALSVAATGLSVLSVNTAKAAKNTELLAEQLGLTTKEMQELELVTNATINDFDGMEKSFREFNAALNSSTAGTNKATREMEALGIAVFDTDGKVRQSRDLYFEAAHAAGKLGDENKRLYLSRLLFGQYNTELVKILSEGNEAYEQRRQQVLKLSYVIDSKGLKSARELTKSWRRFGIIVDNVKKELAVKFLPVFNKALKTFEEWFVANKKIISQNITLFIKVLSGAFSVLAKVIDLILIPIKAVIELFGGLENTARVLGVALLVVLAPALLETLLALKAITAFLLFNPMTVWIAGIGALAVAIGLLVDDLYHFAQGSKSVFGFVLKKFFDFEGSFKDIIDNITGYFFDKFTAIKDFFEGLIDTFSFGLRKTVKETNQAKKDVKFVDKKTGLNVTLVEDPNKRKINFVKTEPSPKNKGYIDEGTGLNIINLEKNELSNNQNVLTPDLSKLNTISTNNRSINNRITNNITENISISVPSGTTQEQVNVISEQVTDAIQKQFDANMLRGMDYAFDG